MAHSIIPGKVVHTYVDGVQNGPDFNEMSAKKKIVSTPGRPLALGVSFEFNTEFLPAELDEISLWSYDFSKEEVKELMNAPVTKLLAVELTGKLPATWGVIKVGY